MFREQQLATQETEMPFGEENKYNQKEKTWSQKVEELHTSVGLQETTNTV